MKLESLQFQSVAVCECGTNIIVLLTFVLGDIVLTYLNKARVAGYARQ